MKLIDLLVQELPKRGGWPDGAKHARQDDDGEICFQGSCGCDYDFIVEEMSSDSKAWLDEHNRCTSDFYITREQYEAAFAAAQQPVWNGEGLPPVGMHCEIVDPVGALMYGQGESGEVVAHVEDTAVIRMSYGLGCFEAQFLRPSRSEAEKKRDAAIEDMRKSLGHAVGLIEVSNIYLAIAAGEVRGVRIE